MAHRLLSAFVSVLLIGPALAADPGCKGNPGLIGSCRTIDGGLFLSGDRGVVVGNEREEYIVDVAPGSDRDMPAEPERILLNDLRATIVGRFEICPVPARHEDERQHACVESVSDMRVEH